MGIVFLPNDNDLELQLWSKDQHQKIVLPEVPLSLELCGKSIENNYAKFIDKYDVVYRNNA